jgi:hypothetical protein
MRAERFKNIFFGKKLKCKKIGKKDMAETKIRQRLGIRRAQLSVPTGLPDGIFSYQKFQFGYNWNGKCWYIFKSILEFGIPILWPVHNFVIIWHISTRFGILLYQEKSGNPVH